jgi:hypothetical protein
VNGGGRARHVRARLSRLGAESPVHILLVQTNSSIGTRSVIERLLCFLKSQLLIQNLIRLA